MKTKTSEIEDRNSWTEMSMVHANFILKTSFRDWGSCQQIINVDEYILGIDDSGSNWKTVFYQGLESVMNL